MQKRTAVILLFVLSCTLLAAAQQDKSQRPSPPASAECKFPDGKTIHSDYSSPRLRGRKMLGAHEPYGQVWRLGANEATTLVTDTPLMIAGKTIPAGSYTMFAIPNPDKWTLIINKKTGEWGIPYKWEADELLRTDIQVKTLDSPMENFTISFQPNGASCGMHLQWETTDAYAAFAEGR